MGNLEITNPNKFAIIIGIGGAGCNVLSYIYRNCNYNGVDCLALNTNMDDIEKYISQIPLNVQDWSLCHFSHILLFY